MGFGAHLYIVGLCTPAGGKSGSNINLHRRNKFSPSFSVPPFTVPFHSLQELLDPANLQRAGRFFEEIFTGADFELDDLQRDPADECVTEFPSDPWAIGQLQPAYSQWSVGLGQGVDAPAVYGGDLGGLGQGVNAPALYGGVSVGFCMPRLSGGLDNASPNMTYPSPPVHFQPGMVAMGASSSGDLGYSYGAPSPSIPVLYPCQQIYSLSIAPYTVGTTGMYAPCYSLGNRYGARRRT